VLQRIEHPNGVVTYRSQALGRAGIPHAFTTRIGGVSASPYATLNLGPLTKEHSGDHNTLIAENYRRLRRAIGCERHIRIEVKQIHGKDVWIAPNKPVRPADIPFADAIISGRPGHLLVIRTADCVPILIATEDGKYVAAIHAGWRGLVAGVIPAAIRQLPGKLTAAIGPCIGPDHFEVQHDVSDQIDHKAVRHVHSDRPHIDLQAEVIRQLHNRGVQKIDTNDCCTYRDEEEFFSHRRDVTHRKGDTGRMAAVIAHARG